MPLSLAASASSRISTPPSATNMARMQREDDSEAHSSVGQTDIHVHSSLDRICTIGYEGRDIAEFIEVLTSAEVTLVVDVRENAMSRIRGFSKRRLHETLGDSGISYEHLKRLGNPKENRGALRTGNESAVRFFENRLLAEGAEELRHLMQLAAERTRRPLVLRARPPDLPSQPDC